MSRDLPFAYSTPVDNPQRLQSLPQDSYRSGLNGVFTYVAQEVAELLQQSHYFPVNCDNNGVETIAIRALEPVYKLIITIKPLTVRELEVLQLIVKGHNNSEIARKLHITVGTVKSHVSNILNKLCVSDRTQAAIRALRSGLVH